MEFLPLAALLAIAFLSVTRFAAAKAKKPAKAPEKHPFNVHDLLAMDRLSDLQVAPDGSRLAFCVRVTDLDANKGVTQIWTCLPDGGERRQLTAHAASSSHPRWAPDSQSLYFLSSRSDSSQVWRIPLDGGEAKQVTDLPLDVGAFAISPTNKHLAVALEVFLNAKTLDETKQRLDEQKESKATGQLYEQLMFRHWDTWKDGRRSHLFVVHADGSGKPVDVMKEMQVDCPSKPFGGAEEFTFTPDGKSLVFSAKDAGREEAWSTHHDLYVVAIDGKDKPHIVTKGNAALATNPVFSPDGKQLAWLAMERPGYEADRLRICVKDWPSGQTRVVTDKWDRSAGTIVWSPDSKLIYTAANHLGQNPLFAVDVATHQVEQLLDKGKVTAIGATKDRVIIGRCYHQSPTELYALKPDGEDRTQITEFNRDKLAQVKLGDSEQFSFKGWNDEDVYCYVVKPVDFDEEKTYPVAFLIHGGPQGSFGNDFHYRWNPQIYAAAGYAAVMVDFHGSTGYGQAFTDAINQHWTDRPLEDLQKGLAAALVRYPWMDKKRVAALGASYGGFMINWIAGNWPDRFTCLVNHDGNIDERMAYYDTEELWFPEWERGGTPWDVPEAYTAHNPIDHVAKWKTPMLVIHGGKDYRVVDTQGLSTFTALQRKGIPSKLLYFADENHWVLKPANSIQWHETVLAWLNQWTK
jgi:dipeptidyl aminopeptidase/acylaminoacyl peptidase